MSNLIEPSLQSITIKAKYLILNQTFEEIVKTVDILLGKNYWISSGKFGNSFQLYYYGDYQQEALDKLVADEDITYIVEKVLKDARIGIPISINIVLVERTGNDCLVEIDCRPTMWHLIVRSIKTSFTENEIQESQIECKLFIKQIMSCFNNKIIEDIAVYPIIKKNEIKGRLLNLGIKKAVKHLDKSEKLLCQNNFESSLKSSRTAFEKMIDWEIKKRGLGKTNNYKNDVERLASKGYIDASTKDLIQTYYRCLSNLAVHSKEDVEPGFHEAQMGYGITLIIMQYFANKLP